MEIEIKDFRGIKFGEPSKDVRPLRTDPDGISWCDRQEEYKVGIIRVSTIEYGFYKGKFMMGRITFGGEEEYLVLLTALNQKYGKFDNLWKIGNIRIKLNFNSNMNYGTLIYEYDPLVVELKTDLEKKQTAELKMKVNAAKGDL
jgi:hypothetical protein